MVNHQQQIDLSAEILSSTHIDKTFEKVACLGHGGFGSVFLAKKKSGRHVALKLMRISLDDDEDEIHDSFQREVNAVLKLDCATDDGSEESIVYFRDWFRGPNFACIVMPYVNGGTLAQEIESRTQPYSERRIIYYALQLCDALAYAHSKGVAHYDVKATNVLLDRNEGGKLVLADFGSSVSPGEEGRSFTKLFAAPELQAAYDRDVFTGLQPEKIDSFALGCILFEMVCSKRMVDFEGDETIGEFILREQSADAALILPQICLPWLTPNEVEGSIIPRNVKAGYMTGYSSGLRYLIKSLLELQPSLRWTPSELQKPLRQDGSPLLADFCTAGLVPQPGAPVTIDNIQLGMFVQRGRDWNDGDADGGYGSVGVVIRLDADAEYTEVSFPSRNESTPKLICCRIGKGNKYELQVGPMPITDFIHCNTTNEIITKGGVIYSQEASNYHAGQMINPNCTVLYCQPNRMFVTHLERICIPTQDIPKPTSPPIIAATLPRKPRPIPMTWNLDIGKMVPLSEGLERQLVLDLFFSTEGGMDIQSSQIISIHAIQFQLMWEAYAIFCEDIAVENWSNPNERRLFHGTGNHSPESLLINTPQAESFYQNCAKVVPGIGGVDNGILFSNCALFADRYAHKCFGIKKIILSRVALGRIKGADEDNLSDFLCPLQYHSTYNTQYQSIYSTQANPVNNRKVLSVTNEFQAYPEFIITYKDIQRPVRRNVQVLPLNCVPSKIRTPVFQKVVTVKGQKMCVVCLERPVGVVLIPCGHTCLCLICSSYQGLIKLKNKCPECRTIITMANRFYGTMIE